jgi:hypothetical protein
MEPYENQLIGAFIFELGRRSPKEGIAAINLFQQTPLDTVFGDLVVGATRCLLFEFKRSAAQLKSERAKRSLSERLAWKRSTLRQEQAHRGHLVVYGHTTGEQVDMRWCGYLNVINETPALDRGSVISIIQFLTDEAFRRPPKSAKEIGLGPQEMSEYLAWLKTIKSKGGRAASSGGREAWLGVAATDNGVMFISADSLSRLLEREPQPAHRRVRTPGQDLER